MRHRWLVHTLWCVFVLTSLLLAGCLGSREWMYPPPPSEAYLDTAAAKPHTAGLVVLPLEDQRGTTAQEDYWKVTFPLVPHAVTTYDRPETTSRPERVDEVFFDPPSDFARAIADEIRNANIFSSVTFQADDEPVPPNAFVMRGRLHSTRWERTLSSYLLGPFGTLAWMAGFPMGTVTTSVIMDLQLTSAEHPDHVMWNFSMEFEGHVWDGAYYELEKPVIHYPKAVQEALQPALFDLSHAMSMSMAR